VFFFFFDLASNVDTIFFNLGSLLVLYAQNPSLQVFKKYWD
jgi:hypothetical protein